VRLFHEKDGGFKENIFFFHVSKIFLGWATKEIDRSGNEIKTSLSLPSILFLWARYYKNR
jgi:hypothetical protein